MLGTANLVAFAPVTDLARARRFYESTLGLTVRRADDYGCMLDANGTSGLRGRHRTYDDRRTPSSVGGFRCCAAGGRGGCRHYGQAWRPGDLVAWFSDSEGNTLSVTQSA